MKTSGEQLSFNLQDLIRKRNLTKIRIYRFNDFKLHHESVSWSFGSENIFVNDQDYNLNKLITYQTGEDRLSLYF